MEETEFLLRLGQITDLPTIAETALEVNRLLDNPGATIDQVSNVIRKDQAIVVKILRLVNSSFFGMQTKVGTIPRAIVILGLNTVRNALISVSVIDSFKHFGSTAIDIRKFWFNSIACAVVGKALAVRTRLSSPEEAFTAGVVHDIGKLVLAKYFPDEFNAIMAAVSTGVSFYDAEASVIPSRHNSIGADLATRWHFPKNICDAIRCSYGEVEAAMPPLAGLVRCAGEIVNSGWMETTHTETGFPPFCGILEKADFARDDLPNWKSEVNSEIQSACRFLMEEGEHE